MFQITFSCASPRRPLTLSASAHRSRTASCAAPGTPAFVPSTWRAMARGPPAAAAAERSARPLHRARWMCGMQWQAAPARGRRAAALGKTSGRCRSRLRPAISPSQHSRWWFSIAACRHHDTTSSSRKRRRRRRRRWKHLHYTYDNPMMADLSEEEEEASLRRLNRSKSTTIEPRMLHLYYTLPRYSVRTDQTKTLSVPLGLYLCLA